MEHCYTTKYALSILLAAAVASGSGCCTQLHHLPDECAAVIYECDLARLIHNVCSCEPLPDCASGVGCGSTVPCDCGSVVEDTNFVEEQYERRRVEVGPPPVTYKPPMPPKFLPVPSRPVFSQTSVLAPSSAHNPVEVDFDANFNGQLTFPGLK
ncbi:MAG: hypothetical protein GXP28_01870 [Planctomycetes bacterium]|nr:hypothetical protein [Planctomycetota bacterium]